FFCSQGHQRINLDIPYWDLNTFIGRLKYYFWVTDPRTAFISNKKIDDAKELLNLYRHGQEPKHTTPKDIKYARKLYESAFHPDSGEKMNVFGRMSFQVPGGMVITGAMLQFYKTVPEVVFWQWMNQSFNAVVNYTNRNAESPLTPMKIGLAYVTATGSALITAIKLKSYLQRTTAPFMQRFVPFAAVAAANCANIPLMRQSELLEGIAVFDENGNKVTESRVAAVKGISQVVFSRIIMAAPGMLILPFIMQKLETYAWMKRVKYLHAPMQFDIYGTDSVHSLKVSTIKRFEPKKYYQMEGKLESTLPERVYFNKGL
uniref:Sidoreflexin n=1 Tax=Strigamia maritima TaxID=126957 RepID=T1IIV2_STRMM